MSVIATPALSRGKERRGARKSRSKAPSPGSPRRLTGTAVMLLSSGGPLDATYQPVQDLLIHTGAIMERRLAAILAADVVGYSRLMEQDEAGTFTRLRAHREELFEPEIARHHGRIFSPADRRVWC